MGATISTTSPLARQTLIPSAVAQTTHLRHFARWVPYKPQPKPKHHQKLRAIKNLKALLEDCHLVSPFTCHGFSCNQFKALKTPLSSEGSSAKLVVAKNSLVAKAFEGTPWEALAPCMKGMNALLFVKKEEGVGEAMAGVKGVVKEGKLEFNEFSGAVVDGRLYGHLDLEVLEGLGTKLESDGMVLGTLYSPASSLMALLQGFGDEGEVAGEIEGSQTAESEAKAP